MLHARTTALAAALLVLPALAQGPARWEAVTDGYPTTAAPPWDEVQSLLCADATATVSGVGFTMRIDHTSPCPDDLLVYRFVNGSPALPFPRQFWIEGVMSVVQSGDARPDEGVAMLHVRKNNTCGWYLEIDTGEVFLTWDDQRMASFALQTDIAHRYRLVTDTTTELASVWVDGAPVIQGVAPGPQCITPGVFDTAAAFGNGRPAEPGITEWSEVRHNLAEGDGVICELFATFNSTGANALVSAVGSRAVTDNALELRADGLPPGSFGIFLVSPVPSSLPVAAGPSVPLCLGGTVGRFVGPGQVLQASAAGAVQMPLDNTRLPQGAGFVAALPGDSWGFQYWYRDTSFIGFGLSTALDVLFL